MTTAGKAVQPHRGAAALVVAGGLLLGLAGAGPALAQSTEPPRDLVAADNRLGLDLLQRLPSPGNAVISPHSIATAMAMARAGARAATERELMTALGTGQSPEALAADHRRLNDIFNAKSAEGGAIFQVTNALHLTRGGDVIAPAFRQFLADRFGAEIFAGSDLGEINSWVKQRTNGRIERILNRLDANSVCVLLNAVYFKAAWLERFDRRATRPEGFHLASGETVQVPTMHQVGYFQLRHEPGFDAVRLAYRKSSIAMTILLPERADGVPELEANLFAGALSAVLADVARARTGKVDLGMPSFKIESGGDFIPLFQSLGVRLAFDRDRADFSGMTGSTGEQKRLHISQIQHRAFIDVNEDGTEAAAATAVEFAKRAAPGQPTTLKIDRPFLYVVSDELSGAILFVGRVMDPRS